MILANRPHVQGALLGTAMLAVAAAGTPSAWHAAQDLFEGPPPAGKVATADRSPKSPQSVILITSPAPSGMIAPS